MPLSRWRQYLLPGVLGGLSIACSPSPERDPGRPPGSRGDVIAAAAGHLTVTNRHRHEVEVLAISTGSPVRLGRVAAESTAEFTLPDQIAGRALRFSTLCVVEDEGDNSRVITWSQGESVDLTVDADLHRSQVSVRR